MSEITEGATKLTVGDYSTERLDNGAWAESDDGELVGVSDRMRCPTLRAGDTFTIQTRLTIA
ncbi:MAG TPA: hypothetical protein VK537_07575 [Galbitalea sp.]|nr:hypothetical protein [Galbitalea sp.]